MPKKEIILKEPWKSDIVYYNKITKETGSLLIEQMSAILEETVDTAKSITSKAEKIITILIPISSALLTYFITTLPKNGLTVLTLSCALSFIIVCISLLFVYQNFKSYTIYIPGLPPETILTAQFINATFSNEEQYGNLILVIGENIQDRIEKNEILNSQRLHKNMMALKWLFAIIFTPFLAYLILFLYR